MESDDMICTCGLSPCIPLQFMNLKPRCIEGKKNEANRKQNNGTLI